MRRAEGKRYGYIILPIGIPADMKPEDALKDNEKYKVVWQVLQALRAHDDRFNATINKLELNEKRPDNIQIIGIGGVACAIILMGGGALGGKLGGLGGLVLSVLGLVKALNGERWRIPVISDLADKF